MITIVENEFHFTLKIQHKAIKTKNNLIKFNDTVCISIKAKYIYVDNLMVKLLYLTI